MPDGALEFGSGGSEDGDYFRAIGAEQPRQQRSQRRNSIPVASPETPFAASCFELFGGLYDTVTRRGFCTPQVRLSPLLISNCCGSGTRKLSVLPSSLLRLKRSCFPAQSTRNKLPAIFSEPVSSNHSTVFAASCAESGR